MSISKHKKIINICLIGIFTSILFNMVLASGYSVPIQGISKKSSNYILIASLSNALSMGPGADAADTNDGPDFLAADLSSIFSFDTNTSNIITMQDAIQTVLARVPGASINDVKIKLKNIDSVFGEENEAAKIRYVGTVRHEKTSYDFEIDGLTGHFIAWE